MVKLIQKAFISACTLSCLTAIAQEPDQFSSCDSSCNSPCNSFQNSFYFGGFGGWVFPYDLMVTQLGTAFFPDSSGGPLDVRATGIAHKETKGFGGLHIGYEWMKEITPCFRLAPAFELEGIYFSNNRKADVDNPTTRLDAHEFIDTLPMRIGALLATGVLEFNNDYISPYIGFGAGVGFVSIHGANSAQIDPPEAGINHFNSDPNDFNTLFAFQAKGGLRYRFYEHYRLSAEYRFFYMPSSFFTFGSTRYSTHVPTSTWMIQTDAQLYNAVTLGIDFLF